MEKDRAGTAALRIFATCDIGREALDRLRERGWEVEVYGQVHAPPKGLVLEKVRSGIAALVTTLRDVVDEEVLAAGEAAGLRVVSQIAVGVDNIDRAAANRHRIPFTHTPDVLTDATAEYAFLMMGAVARRLYPAERQVRAREWTTWHPYLPWLGDEVTGRTLAVIGMGRIGQSMAGKAVGFDMDVLCYSPSRSAALVGFVTAVQRLMDLRHREGLSGRKQAIEVVSLEEALRRAKIPFRTRGGGLLRLPDARSIIRPTTPVATAPQLLYPPLCTCATNEGHEPVSVLADDETGRAGYRK